MNIPSLPQGTRLTLLNSATLLLIIILVVVVSIFSFAQKSNEYLQYGNKLTARVVKKEFPIITQTNGTVESTAVNVGDRVTKGQSLFQLSNPLLDRQIELLKSYSKDNNSAQLQLVELQLEKTAQTSYSPINGTVESFPDEGESVNKADKVGYILSDNNVKIVLAVNENDYRRLQVNIGTLKVLKRSTGATYSIKYDGLQHTNVASSSSVDPNQTLNATLSFSNTADAGKFLHEEEVDVVLFTTSSTIPQPIEWLLGKIGLKR